MRVEKAIKKIEKELGVKVEKLYENAQYHAKYAFKYEDRICTFLTQQAYGEDKNGNYGKLDYAEAMNWHTQQMDDVSDPMTDYFAGYFLENCTQLIRSCKPPEPKYPVGCLVRGKQNKRAIRQGYAGKTGMVIDAGEYMKIKWLDHKVAYEYMTYPQRDMELVSAA